MITCDTSNSADIFQNIIVRDYSEVGLGMPGGSSTTNDLFINGYFPLASAYGGTGTDYGGSPINIIENAAGTGKNATVSNNIFQQDQIVANNNMITIITQLPSGTEGTLTFNNNWIIGKNGFVTGFIEGPSWAGWSMTGDYWTNTNGIALADVPVTITSGTAFSPSVGTFAGLVTIQSGGSLTQSGNTLCSGSWCGPTIPSVQ
jgi:hypothetical protein